MIIPDSTQHLSIVGANGSGKSQAAIWHLSVQDYLARPWVVYNWKEDDGINGIPGKIDIDLNEIPKRPGIYVAHPMPEEDDELVDRQMREIWSRQNMGVFVDEGYMIGRNSRGFRRLLTQGRSRHNGMIILSQRPCWIDPFAFTESRFFQVFRLQHKKDRQKVEEFVPADLSVRLPEFYSYYYDVGANDLRKLAPVPMIGEIYKTFDARLSTMKKVL